jgi:HK97 family phage major capsid protein
VKKNSHELSAEVEALRAEIVELDAVEAPTEEQTARFDAAITEFDARKAELDEAVAREEKVAAVRAAAANPANVTPAFHAPEVNVKRDAFDNLEGIARGTVSPSEMTARALTVIEDSKVRSFTDAHRARATELAELDPSIARHILLTGSDAYRSAFDIIMRNPEHGMFMLDDEQRAAVRAALSNTAANGGYTIPFLLDPTVILTNDGAVNPFRAISTVVTGTADKWNGVTSAGVTAEWLAEASEAADASPTVGQPSITARKGAAYIFSSYEQEADGQLVSQLPRLIADAKDRLEATAFATGNGSTAPEGIVTGVTAVTASRVAPTTGGTFTSASIADTFKVANALTPRSQSNASWVANKAVLNIIRQQAAAQNSANSVWTDFALGTPSTLLGSSVYEASAMTGTVTTGSNILLAGDFRAGFYIYDRVGVEMRYEPIVKGTTNGRPTGQSGWFAFWRTGSKVVDPNAFRVLLL